MKAASLAPALAALAVMLAARGALAHEGDVHPPAPAEPAETGELPAGIEIRTADDDVAEVAIPATPAASPSPAVRTPGDAPPREAEGALPERPSERTEVFGDEAVSEDELDRVRHSLPEEDWRRSNNRTDDRRDDILDIQRFLLEFRFGAYFPEVDDEFEGKATPFKDFFGDAGQVYFGLELDWLPLRIPYVGRVGAAYGWGFTKATGKTRLVSDPSAEAGSDTGLTIMPMHASAVLRLDALLYHGLVPVVPYAKLGVGLAEWRATGSSGTSEHVDAGGATVTGNGITTGLHVAVGGALALNALDAAAARSMYAETGIRYAYVWGEWMRDRLDGFGADDVMLVGTSTGVAGLGLEW